MLMDSSLFGPKVMVPAACALRGASTAPTAAAAQSTRRPLRATQPRSSTREYLGINGSPRNQDPQLHSRSLKRRRLVLWEKARRDQRFLNTSKRVDLLLAAGLGCMSKEGQSRLGNRARTPWVYGRDRSRTSPAGSSGPES